MAQHLKLIALLIFTLSASYTSAQSLRKLLERPYGIIESKWEKDAQGTTELNYYNEDYCDYYLYRANDRSYNLSNGKNTIFKIEKNAQVDNPFKSASSYTFCRGKFPKDFNIQTPYALPVKNNQKTAWKTGTAVFHRPGRARFLRLHPRQLPRRGVRIQRVHGEDPHRGVRGTEPWMRSSPSMPTGASGPRARSRS